MRIVFRGKCVHMTESWDKDELHSWNVSPIISINRETGSLEVKTYNSLDYNQYFNSTVSRVGQRIALATAALYPEHCSYIRDFLQDYMQSKSQLERTDFLPRPPEMKLSEGKVLLVKNPLYGIPESGLHWFMTYLKNHIEKHGMSATSGYTFVMFRRKDKENEGITILQVGN